MHNLVKVLVAGASGFVGSRLAPELGRAGHDVVAMTRNPDDYDGFGTAVFGDVEDEASLSKAMADCDAAYYLVHSLDSANFLESDAKNAWRFGTAAGEAGVKQIIYLGGLGDDSDDLSDHLKSRREVEGLLGSANVPVTVLRAGIVIGSGGISWEMTRQLVEHLPAMITPKWVKTRTQPIAVDDVIRYLVGVLGNDDAIGKTFDVGGPEILSYADMLHRVAGVEDKTRIIIPVPLLTPRLSSYWLSFVTDIDNQTGRSLVDSMTNEVVVRDDSIRKVVPFEPMAFDDAVVAALADRARNARP
jgi:uncharacterized protein YbjT (DUF2867 family)